MVSQMSCEHDIKEGASISNEGTFSSGFCGSETQSHEGTFSISTDPFEGKHQGTLSGLTQLDCSPCRMKILPLCGESCVISSASGVDALRPSETAMNPGFQVKASNYSGASSSFAITTSCPISSSKTHEVSGRGPSRTHKIVPQPVLSSRIKQAQDVGVYIQRQGSVLGLAYVQRRPDGHEEDSEVTNLLPTYRSPRIRATRPCDAGALGGQDGGSQALRSEQIRHASNLRDVRSEHESPAHSSQLCHGEGGTDATGKSPTQELQKEERPRGNSVFYVRDACGKSSECLIEKVEKYSTPFKTEPAEDSYTQLDDEA